MKSRDIAVVGILLAIGAILRYLSNIVPGAIVANPIIALYCLAIILIVPRVKDALGIGIVAGIISALISHSIFPPANLISEPLGALVCLGVYIALRNRLPLSAGIATFIATLASGFTFLAVSLFVIASSIIPAPGENFTMGAFILAVSPIIILTAIANSLISQILYFPSSRILMRGMAAEPPDRHHCAIPEPGNVPDAPMIRFHEFSYTYPLARAPALSSIDVSIEQGQCVLVNGPTGAGKTTFCLAAAGILTHDYEGTMEGSVEILGKDASRYEDMGEIGRIMGVVFDDADAQLIFTTVEEEVLSGLENRGLDPHEVRRRLEEILRLTKIDHLRYRAPHTLSGGQKQRVSLAATLASGTRCLILDEATAELDVEATATIISILNELKRQGKTIIVVEQKPQEMADIADSVLIIEQGRVTGFLRADEFFASCTEDEHPGPLPSARPVTPCTAPIIEIRDLTHQYGETLGLDRASLNICPGELIAIIGENGSGKTTLVKHLNGLLRPTSGTVTVSGIDAAAARTTDLARHVGLVFQNPDTMLFEDTAEREILFGLTNIGRDAEEAQGQISAVLERVGLIDQRTTFPRSMSRGERQRLAIACVIAMQPDVIILDEPTTGLDVAEAERIMTILEELSLAGHTVIMVSHDMHIVEHHAHRIIRMENGRIISDSAAATGGEA